ncbi:hypothetical protein DMENIID0001_094080 [Sergentomyia squamirostris]
MEIGARRVVRVIRGDVQATKKERKPCGVDEMTRNASLWIIFLLVSSILCLQSALRASPPIPRRCPANLQDTLRE